MDHLKLHRLQQSVEMFHCHFLLFYLDDTVFVFVFVFGILKTDLKWNKKKHVSSKNRKKGTIL